MAERLVILQHANRPGDPPFQADMLHDVVCARRQKCTCQTVTLPGPKAPPVYRPASFRINKGEKSPPLPAMVLLLPQVKTALRRGVLKLVDDRIQVEKI